MGGPLFEQSHLDQVEQILDIGCGPGGWVMAVAAVVPTAQVTGIDISTLMIQYADVQARKQKLSNTHFEVMDATQTLDFPDGTFDLINGRILSGFLATTSWAPFLRECWRIGRPGSILRVSEPEFGFTNSAALDELTTLTAQALRCIGYSFSPRGRTIGTTPMLRFLLNQAGYQHIEQRASVVDYSAGTPFHLSNCQNLLMVYTLLKPLFLQTQVASDIEIVRLYEQLEHDLAQPDFCGLDYYLTVWGRKAEVDGE
jgi:ubiquinone/menaquinone biosynthesis C-methylase UbiE